MQRFVSQDCIDCILEDIRESGLGEHVRIHPLILKRMIEELITRRAEQFMVDDESIAA